MMMMEEDRIVNEKEGLDQQIKIFVGNAKIKQKDKKGEETMHFE